MFLVLTLIFAENYNCLLFFLFFFSSSSYLYIYIYLVIFYFNFFWGGVYPTLGFIYCVNSITAVYQIVFKIFGNKQK